MSPLTAFRSHASSIPPSRTGDECPKRGRKAGIRRTGQVGIFIVVSALLAFASPAKAQYLDDLVVSPHPRLGLAFPTDTVGYYPAISTGGMGIVRLSVSWEWREPAPGQYKWDGLDSRIVSLQMLGVEPFLTFESDAEWATRPETHGITNGTPNKMSEWTAFVSRAVDRYNGDGWNDAPGLLRPVRYYQAANEWIGADNPAGGWRGTDEELVDFINATHDAVKASDPLAVFVLGGIPSEALDVLAINMGLANFEISYRNGPGEPFATRPADNFRSPGVTSFITHVASLISQMKFDQVDLHLYGPADRDPIRIQAARGLIGDVPLLSAECGGPSLNYQDYLPEDHFMAAMQRNLTDLSEGLDYCLWFLLGEAPGGTYCNSKTALFDEFLLAKPGYAAYKLLAYILQDMTTVERGTGNTFTINRQDRPHSSSPGQRMARHRASSRFPGTLGGPSCG